MERTPADLNCRSLACPALRAIGPDASRPNRKAVEQHSPGSTHRGAPGTQQPRSGGSLAALAQVLGKDRPKTFARGGFAASAADPPQATPGHPIKANQAPFIARPASFHLFLAPGLPLGTLYQKQLEHSTGVASVTQREC